MKQSWSDYENAPGPLAIGLKAMVALLILGALGGGVFYACSWFREAGQVAKEEVGPRAAVRKYSWFKDTAQQLQAKKANIDAMDIAYMDAKHEWDGTPPSQIPRDAREALELHRNELLGLKANFNGLAAEYNANVKKVNWRIFNTEELPDEFATYIAK